MDWVSGITQTSDSLSWGIYYLRAIGGFALVFFIPGFAWTLVIFAKLNIVERIVLSFGLSMAIVAMISYIPSKAFGLPITVSTVLISTAATVCIALALYALRRYRENRRGDQ